MSRQLNIENIGEVISEFRNLLGEKFVEEELESFDTKGLREAEVERLSVSSHPIAQSWVNLCAESARSKNDGKLRLSANSLVLLEELHWIQFASKLRGAERNLADVRNRSKFHSGKHEANIAAQYAHFGFDVSFLPEQKEKTADLLVKTATGEVYVECKSFLDRSEDEDPHWSQFERSISKKLKIHKRCWSIYVLCAEVLDHQLKTELTTAVQDQISAENLSDLLLSNDRVLVQFRKIGEPDREVFGEFSGQVPGIRLRVMADVRIVQGQMWHRNPTIISVDSIFDPNQSRRLYNYIKKASRQLPPDRPSVLHIDLNIKDPARIFDVIDECWNPMHRRLEASHRRINAVVLSGGAVLPNPRDPSNSFHRELAVVPNRRGRNSLPSDFCIFGSAPSPSFDKLDGKEGTIFFRFSINEPLEKQTGRTIIFHCSTDGLRQVRIWQTFKNRLRFEVFNPDIGRKTEDFDLNYLVVGELYSFAVTWAKDGVRAYLNGKPLN